MNILKQVRNRQGFTLVELMIVVAIIGILAAIAIPAFMRSVKKSKAAESEQVMRKFTDGSKAYFTSEQRLSIPATGAEPWHAGVVGGPRQTRPGMPVDWNLYVFPGGDGCNIITSAGIPAGGSKIIADPLNNSACAGFEAQALNKLGVTMEDPVYFQYTYAATGTAQAAQVNLTAIADFNPTAALNHTATQLVSIDPNTQEVLVDPVAVNGEFD